MTIARQFGTLLSVAALLVIIFTTALVLQFASLSAEGVRRIENLRRTAVLNQGLADGNRQQGDRLLRQLERFDPAFAAEFRAIDFSLGDQYTEYLKLDIGEDERMAVEAAKALQAETAILSMQIYDLLREGRRAEAAGRLHQLYQSRDLIRNEFEKLSRLQLEKLRAVVDHLNRSATYGVFATYALAGSLLLVAVAGVLLWRRRVRAPLRAILTASEQMRGGDLSARAPVGRPDEIGQLTQGFNYMAESLAASHAGLERKVEERTRELQELQRQLVHAEKMSAIGVLVGGVAHELNNPLAVIMGFTEILRMETRAAGGDARSLKLLADMDAQIERCRRIVANLLQFARQQEPQRDSVDVNALIDQVLQLREYQLATTNVTLVRDFDPAAPVICADRYQMQQVVLNLLNNASDAVGEVDRPGTILFRTRAAQDTVVIDVRDSGPGFRDPDRAFDPFYTTKGVGKGTGLGLSVCYGIVRDHGGVLSVRNWEGGAEVSVVLPVGDPLAVPTSEHAAAHAEPETPPPLPAQRHRALVVDDEEPLQRLQVSFLATLGVDAASAASGDEAIRYLEDHEVDLVISDVRMPGAIDGVALYHWVAAHRPFLARRFIFSSGDLVGLNLDGFFERSGAPCLQKPFRFGQYSETVRRVLAADSQAS